MSGLRATGVEMVRLIRTKLLKPLLAAPSNTVLFMSSAFTDMSAAGAGAGGQSIVAGDGPGHERTFCSDTLKISFFPFCSRRWGGMEMLDPGPSRSAYPRKVPPPAMCRFTMTRFCISLFTADARAVCRNALTPDR